MAGRNSFDDFARKLRDLKSNAFKTELAQRCGAAAMKTTADCFRGSHDPYGTPWAPLKQRAGKPLQDTGRLSGSIASQPGEGTFKLVAPVIYAAVHQFGATIKAKAAKALAWRPRGGKQMFFAKQVTIPARPFFPTAERGIPVPMQEAFKEEHAGLVRERLGL